MTTILTIILTVIAILIILTISSGIWLTKTGRPPKKGILTIHKLFALISVIVIIIIVLPEFKKTESFSVLFISIVILSLISTIILFFTGGMLSTDREKINTLTIIHKIFSPVFVLSIATMLFLLL